MMETTKATSSVATNVHHNFSEFTKKSKDAKIKHESILFTFPAVMKQLNQWLLWELRNGKKIPLNTNYNVTDPTKGFSFQKVIEAYDSARCNGLGFVVGSNVVCVDIDHCINNGEVSELAEKLADELDTYVELSQSGSGIHLFYVDNEIPEGFTGFHKTIEVYAEKHYIAMTGISISNPEIAVLNGKTAELIQRFNAQQKQSEETKQTEEQNQSGEQKGTEAHTDYVLSNEEILRRVNLVGDVKFTRLFYEGNIEGYASQSEADAALLVKLALLTGCNREQMRELFTQSALGKRGKWTEREDYQEYRLDNAIQYVNSEMKNSTFQAIKTLQKFYGDQKLTQEVYIAAVTCKGNIQFDEYWNQFQTFCKINKKTLHTTITEFNENVKIAQNHLKLIKQMELKTEIHQMKPLTLPEPYNNIKYIIPEEYAVNSNGIYIMTGDGYKLICDSAIYITQIITDYKSKEQKSQLYIFTQGYGWSILDMVDNTILTNAQRLALEIGKKNMNINSNSSSHLVKYFAKFFSCNSHTIQKIQSTTSVGWIQNDFVTPYNSSKYLVDTTVNSFANALKIQGEFETWKNNVLPAFQYSPITRFILSASFAPVLLKPLKSRSFTVYLWCNSTYGKSTLFQLAASVWGDSEVVVSFGGTMNGLMSKVFHRSGFPFILDEKQQKRENLNINRLIMTLNNGQSDSKLKKDSSEFPTYYWKTIGLFNGEEPIIEDTATNGIFTRTLMIQAQNMLLPRDLMIKLWADVIDQNYGVAGKKFIDILPSIDFTELKQKYLTLSHYLQSIYRNHLPEHLEYVALIAITEQLISEHIFQVASDYKNMIRNIIQLLDTQQETSNTKNCWEHLVSWVAANKSHFNTPKFTALSPCYGEYKKDCLAITKTSLAEEFTHWSNFHVTKVIEDLYQADKILTYEEKNGKLRKLWSCVINGIRNVKCIRIPLKYLTSETFTFDED